MHDYINNKHIYNDSMPFAHGIKSLYSNRRIKDLGTVSYDKVWTNKLFFQCKPGWPGITVCKYR